MFGEVIILVTRKRLARSPIIPFQQKPWRRVVRPEMDTPMPPSFTRMATACTLSRI